MALPFRSGSLPETHLLPDQPWPGLRLVFCGTALGWKWADARAYYANPTNLFWRTMHEMGLTSRRLMPAGYARLLDEGIGLADLAKHDFGNDADLPGDALGGAAWRDPAISARHPRLNQQSRGTRLFVLPSGSARRCRDVAVWRT